MIEITHYFCPNENCKCYGLRSQKNLVKAGKYKTSHGEERQMIKCKICGTRFSETQNTIFYGSHYSSKAIRQILNCAVEGNGVRSTSRLLEFSKDGVNKILLKAGRHCEIVLSSLLTALNMEECQLDELWTFVQKKKILQKKI